MKIRVDYRMSAYIEADTLEDCRDMWINTPITQEEQQEEGWFGTEYVELLGVYNADTLEEINTKNW